MTTGRPSIRPNPDHRTSVVSCLGADERKVGETVDGDEFLCSVCNDDGVVFGVEDDVSEELKEDCASAYPFPTFTQSVYGPLCDALPVPVVVHVLRRGPRPRIRPSQSC